MDIHSGRLVLFRDRHAHCSRGQVTSGRWDAYSFDSARYRCGGTPALRVRRARIGSPRSAVAAPAVEGKANEAVRKALAGAFGIRRQDVVIVSGERSRDKIVELPDSVESFERLRELLA